MPRRTSNARAIAAVISAAITLLACSHATQPRPQPAAAPQGELSAIAKARADSVRHPYTEADIRFMSGMIHHHAQAILMARWAPTHGARPDVRTLAERIDVSQRDEIATMQRWLRERHEAAPDPVPHLGHAGMDMAGPLMPGMLTAEELAQLDRATGPEFDRLFLTFMIRHHEGALTMVDQLFASPGAGQDVTIFRFASDVTADQTTEIERMRSMLAALGSATSRP
jgi:uncharacterized protein (DUF305 family)